MQEVDGVFDRVLLDEDGRQRWLRPAEYFALPLPVRIQHLLKRTVSFYRGSSEVDRNVALDALRRAATAA